MAAVEKYTRVKRPSLFEIPFVYQNQKTKSKFCDGFLSTISIFIVPIRFLFRVVTILILTVFLGIGYFAIAFIVAIPSRVVRRIVSIIGHAADPDLANLLTTYGTIPARDFADWHVSPSQTVTVVIKIKGQVESIEYLRQHVLKSAVQRTNKITGELEYPELQQYVTKKFGYLFFKWDRNFDIANHVQVFHCPDLLPDPENMVVDDDKLTEIWEKLSEKPYDRKRSAWEVLLIPNFSPKNSADNLPMSMKEYNSLPKDEKRNALVLRFHHGYADGPAIYRFLLTMTDHGLEMWEKEHNKWKVTKWQHFKTMLYALFCGPFDLAREVAVGIDFRNMLHPHWSKKTGRNIRARVTLPLKVIKNARRAHNEVSFHSVLIAGITGGIRCYFLKRAKGIPFTPVKLGIPIPQQGHSRKLRNEYRSSLITLPIEKSTGRSRVYACEKRLNSLKHGAMTPFLTLAINLIGGLPVQLARFLTKKSDFTVLYSEMKGPDIELKIDNGKKILEDLYYSYGLGCDDLAVGFSSLSYKGKIHLILTVDQGICRDSENVQELMRLIEKEIEALQYGDCTNL